MMSRMSHECDCEWHLIKFLNFLKRSEAEVSYSYLFFLMDFTDQSWWLVGKNYCTTNVFNLTPFVPIVQGMFGLKMYTLKSVLFALSTLKNLIKVRGSCCTNLFIRHKKSDTSLKITTSQASTRIFCLLKYSCVPLKCQFGKG